MNLTKNERNQTNVAVKKYIGNFFKLNFIDSGCIHNFSSAYMNFFNKKTIIRQITTSQKTPQESQLHHRQITQ